MLGVMKFNLTSLLDLAIADERSGGPSQGQSAREGGGGSGRTSWKLVFQRYQPGSTNGSPKQLSREEINMTPVELWAKKFCEDKAENRRSVLPSLALPPFSVSVTHTPILTLEPIVSLSPAHVPTSPPPS